MLRHTKKGRSVRKYIPLIYIYLFTIRLAIFTQIHSFMNITFCGKNEN